MGLLTPDEQSDTQHMSSNSAYRRLGELLVDQGLLSTEQLEQALALQSTTNRRFGELLIDLGFVREEHVTAALAHQFDHDVVDLNLTRPKPDAIRAISSEYALQRLVLPIRNSQGTMVVAICDPLDFPTIDDLKTMIPGRVQFVLATPTSLTKAIKVAYRLVSVSPAKRAPKPQKDRKMMLDLYASPDSVSRKAA